MNRRFVVCLSGIALVAAASVATTRMASSGAP
jgi:hypothetical protein